MPAHPLARLQQRPHSAPRIMPPWNGSLRGLGLSGASSGGMLRAFADPRAASVRNTPKDPR